jgi:hypothetical protein
MTIAEGPLRTDYVIVSSRLVVVVMRMEHMRYISSSHAPRSNTEPLADINNEMR